MEIKNQLAQCPNGHYYNSALHTSCPFCEQGGIPPTEPFPGTPGPAASVEPYPSAEGGVSFSRTEPIAVDRAAPVNAHFEPTMIGGDLGVAGGGDPVVGWLVCIEGAEKGKDYRLLGRINTIGRGEKSDVRIQGDPTISHVNHARVGYGEKNNRFNLLPGDGRNIVYLNDEEVFSPMPLKAYDLIDFGETKLIFIPLCGEQFTWTPEPGEGGHGTV